MTRLNTCRLCKKSNFESSAILFKYGPRHYVHAKCGFEKWGNDFIDKLPTHALGELPGLELQRRGLFDIVRQRIQKHEEFMARVKKGDDGS